MWKRGPQNVQRAVICPPPVLDHQLLQLILLLEQPVVMTLQRRTERYILSRPQLKAQLLRPN